MEIPIRFIMCGHVDHGKSTTLGRLLYDIGCVDTHEFEKIQTSAERDGMSTWVYARILDTLESEQKRGKTIEHLEIDFSYEDHKYQLVDTPGHKQFIREVISAISDKGDRTIGCLIISATEKEFNAGTSAGQTREHAIIMRALGINKLIVLINKMDLISWSQGRYEEAKNSIWKFIKPLRFTHCIFIPISGYKGQNLISNTLPPECNWYKGKSLIEEVTNLCQVQIETSDVIASMSNRFIAKTKFLFIPNIISAGFQCIGHIRNIQTNLSIDKMKPSVLSSTLIATLPIIQFTSEDKIDIKEGDIILLRKGDTTLGVATVKKVQ